MKSDIISCEDNLLDLRDEDVEKEFRTAICDLEKAIKEKYGKTYITDTRGKRIEVNSPEFQVFVLERYFKNQKGKEIVLSPYRENKHEQITLMCVSTNRNIVRGSVVKI